MLTIARTKGTIRIRVEENERNRKTQGEEELKEMARVKARGALSPLRRVRHPELRGFLLALVANRVRVEPVAVSYDIISRLSLIHI